MTTNAMGVPAVTHGDMDGGGEKYVGGGFWSEPVNRIEHWACVALASVEC